MAYTTVPDKTTGDIFTEAMWDTYIRDNLNTGVTVMLANTTLSAVAASITFSGISQAFAHLYLSVYVRGDTAAGNTDTYIRFNGDSGVNYDHQLLYANAATVASGEVIGTANPQIGNMPAASAPANLFATSDITIPYYSQSTTLKGYQATHGRKNGTVTTSLQVGCWAGFWRSASVITSIALLPQAGNFAAGSRATLYGVY